MTPETGLNKLTMAYNILLTNPPFNETFFCIFCMLVWRAACYWLCGLSLAPLGDGIWVADWLARVFDVIYTFFR